MVGTKLANRERNEQQLSDRSVKKAGKGMVCGIKEC